MINSLGIKVTSVRFKALCLAIFVFTTSQPVEDQFSFLRGVSSVLYVLFEGHLQLCFPSFLPSLSSDTAMAAPPEITCKNLQGKWHMNKSLCTRTEEILALQGIGWLTRKAIGLANVTVGQVVSIAQSYQDCPFL